MSSPEIQITRYCCIRKNIVMDSNGMFFQTQNPSWDGFLLDLYDFIKPNYPKFYKMDRLSQLGFLATEVLLRDRILSKEFPPETISVVLSNAHASQDTDMRYFQSTKTLASPALFVYTLPNIVVGEICIRHGIKGEGGFFVTEIFDPEWMSEYVSIVMSRPTTQICVAGWVEAMGDHHDVFLYLAEKKGSETSHKLTAKQLTELYTLDYGRVDGKS